MASNESNDGSKLMDPLSLLAQTVSTLSELPTVNRALPPVHRPFAVPNIGMIPYASPILLDLDVNIPWTPPQGFEWDPGSHKAFVDAYTRRIDYYTSTGPRMTLAELGRTDKDLNVLFRYLNWCKRNIRTYDTLSVESRIDINLNAKDKAKDKGNLNIPCNRMVNNVDTNKRERCGIKPVKFKSGKYHYCLMHTEERNRRQRQRHHNKNLKEDRNETPPSSMSLLCAISDDGFFLDVFPGSHKVTVGNGDVTTPIHHGSLKRVHVPQTYMILFHKHLLHGGSAALSNDDGETGQQRLFAYVTTHFIRPPPGQNDKNYANLISKMRSTDIPQVEATFRSHDLCVGMNETPWQCSEEQCVGRNLETSKSTEPFLVNEWNKAVPGTVVDGNMDKLGYSIVRTSISTEECPYLLLMQKYIQMSSGWQSIKRTGKQPLTKNPKRQQFGLEMKTKPPPSTSNRMKRKQTPDSNEPMKKVVMKMYDIAFKKLERNVISVDANFEKNGVWTLNLEHKKILRNVGKIPRQFPHVDYDTSEKRSCKRTESDLTHANEYEK
jgi:hypothetical protein